MGVAMARIKLNAERLAGYMKTDSSETNGLKFSKIIDFLDPAITDVLGHESESRIARYHESARLVTLRNLRGQCVSENDRGRPYHENL
jgi:hypothetical protein